MKKCKIGRKKFIYMLGIILYLSIYYSSTVLAKNGPLFAMQNENKIAISDILIINEDTKICYEISSEVGRTECKIDDLPYSISYSHPAQFEIKIADFDTTYHTLRFVMYNKDNKYIGKKEYLLKVHQKKQLPVRSHRKAKNFQIGQKPEYKKDYIPILMYHDVVTKVTNSSAQVSTKQFKNQLQALLNAGYTPINFADYVAYKKGIRGLPKQPVILTFDDGYKSNYINAYPILRDMNIEATYFVITSIMGEETTANDHFTWEEAKEMEKSGLIDIQSHTDTHPNMSQLDKNQLLIEITRSFESIENHLGPRDVKVMCYPEFKSSKKSREQSYDLGVQLQITDLAAPMKLSNYPTQLRRIHIHNDLSGSDVINQIKKLTM